jgi:hypothetical protein
MKVSTYSSNAMKWDAWFPTHCDWIHSEKILISFGLNLN